jgi:hypothetical protein
VEDVRAAGSSFSPAYSCSAAQHLNSKDVHTFELLVRARSFAVLESTPSLTSCLLLILLASNGILDLRLLKNGGSAGESFGDS